jgi:hypothetical protein
LAVDDNGKSFVFFKYKKLAKPYNSTHTCENKLTKEMCYGHKTNDGKIFIAATMSKFIPLEIKLIEECFNIKAI